MNNDEVKKDEINNDIQNEEKIDYNEYVFNPVVDPNLASILTGENNKNEDFYLKKYIGVEYPSYEAGGISFAYLLFGEYFLIYRKMYIPAILKYLLSIGIILFGVLAYANQNSSMLNVCIITYMLVQILPIFFVKRFYYNYAKKKVRNILEENKDKNEDELAKICSTKGGTNIFPAIILFVLVLALSKFKDNIGLLKTYEVHAMNLYTVSTNYINLADDMKNGNTVIKQNECYVKISAHNISENYVAHVYAKDKETIYINGHEWMHVIYNDDSKNSYYASDGEYFYEVEAALYNKNNYKCKKSIKLLVDNLNFR